MEILFVILSLVLLIFLCFKGVPIFFSAMISGIFLLLTAGMNPVEQMTTTYVNGLAGYFGKFFFIFVLGSLFGKLTDISGAADAIAKTIIDKLGDKFIIPSIVIAGAVLTYGGVSVFVCMFTLYPLMVSLFKRGDISRTLIPAVYFAGAGTFTGMMPGSPQIQNLMPGQILGTPATAAMLPGMLAAAFEAVLVFVFIIWYTNRSKKKGMHFEMTEKDRAMLELKASKELPGFFIALLPMLILLVALNVLKLSAELALFVGFISGLICYSKFIPWKDIWKHLSDGTKDGTGSLFNTSAVVGFGSLVQADSGICNIDFFCYQHWRKPINRIWISCYHVSWCLRFWFRRIGNCVTYYKRLFCTDGSECRSSSQSICTGKFRTGFSSS